MNLKAILFHFVNVGVPNHNAISFGQSLGEDVYSLWLDVSFGVFCNFLKMTIGKTIAFKTLILRRTNLLILCLAKYM